MEAHERSNSQVTVRGDGKSSSRRAIEELLIPQQSTVAVSDNNSVQHVRTWTRSRRCFLPANHPSSPSSLTGCRDEGTTMRDGFQLGEARNC